jgi:hypothetical protein
MTGLDGAVKGAVLTLERDTLAAFELRDRSRLYGL